MSQVNPMPPRTWIAVLAPSIAASPASSLATATARDHALERQQFGVPIGSFQAVKHKLADMAVALERARATAYFATLALAENDARWPTAVSVAKVAAGDCQRLLAKEGIQLHGGIGYTWEHDMHLYVKRVKTSEALFGTSTWHRARIASELLAAT